MKTVNYKKLKSVLYITNFILGVLLVLGSIPSTTIILIHNIFFAKISLIILWAMIIINIIFSLFNPKANKYGKYLKIFFLRIYVILTPLFALFAETRIPV